MMKPKTCLATNGEGLSMFVYVREWLFVYECHLVSLSLSLSRKYAAHTHAHTLD